jgi:hypothetical protein
VVVRVLLNCASEVVMVVLDFAALGCLALSGLLVSGRV